MRFKLSTLMLLVVGVAIYLGVCQLPDKYAVAALFAISLILLPIAIAGSYCTQSSTRCFWFGVAAACLLDLASTGYSLKMMAIHETLLGSKTNVFGFDFSNLDTKLHEIVLHFYMLLSGSIAWTTAWIFLRTQKPPVPDGASADGPR